MWITSVKFASPETKRTSEAWPVKSGPAGSRPARFSVKNVNIYTNKSLTAKIEVIKSNFPRNIQSLLPGFRVFYSAINKAGTVIISYFYEKANQT